MSNLKKLIVQNIKLDKSLFILRDVAPKTQASRGGLNPKQGRQGRTLAT